MRGTTTHWQSIRSVMPPWPGIEWPKSLMPNARLKPEAKKPPKGAKSEANVAMTSAWIWNGAYGIEGTVKPICDGEVGSVRRRGRHTARGIDDPQWTSRGR